MAFLGLGCTALLGLTIVIGVDCSVDYTKEIAKKPLKVAGFNIRVFGQSKMENNEAVDILIKILRRYDITLVQEIRDARQEAIFELVAKLNSVVFQEENVKDAYKVVVSARLGRTNSKEQYGFVYRQAVVNITDTYQYPMVTDEGVEAFERPPFVVRVHAETADVQDFAIIGIHVKPSDAVNEISNLTVVYEAVRSRWQLTDILILGDFNADCDYVKTDELKQISLYTNKTFKWLIGNGDDSTVKETTECSYDRFVIPESALFSAVLPGSVKIFRYDLEYKLSEAFALEVSDHFPIELKFQGKVARSALSHYSASVSVRVDDDKTYNATIMASLARARNSPEYADYEFMFGYDRNNKKTEVRWMRKNVADVVKKLDTFRNIHSHKLFSDMTLGYVQLFVQSEVLASSPSVYGIPTSQTNLFDFTVICDYVSPYKCRIEVAKTVTKSEGNVARNIVTSGASSTESEIIRLIKDLVAFKMKKHTRGRQL